MALPEVEELRSKASSLRALATHVESLPDDAKTYASGTMSEWSGPNAEDVRGQLGNWKTTCQSVAGNLRDEATRCETEANNLTEQ